MRNSTSKFVSKSRRKKRKSTLLSVVKEKPKRQRQLMVLGVMILAVLGLSGKLYHLQIVEGAYLSKEAKKQQLASLTPYVPRRQIIDRQGNVMAIDRLRYSLYLHPLYFTEDPTVIAQELAKILPEYTVADFLAKFKSRQTGILVTNNLPEHLAIKIKNLSFSGIDLDEYYARFYPQGEMAAAVVGYVNKEHKGQAGIEYSQETIVQPDLPKTELQIPRTATGILIPAEIPQGMLKVDDLKVKLTLDLRLQKIAKTALLEQMQRYRAKRGTVIVMDVNNGAILALVCAPTYNPNYYYQYPLELHKNWAITDLYEPGSTFKPINVAIALEMGVIDADTRIYDEGKLKIDTWEVRNHDYEEEGGHGWLSIAEILQKSSNVGMIHVMKRIPPSDYYRYLVDLGLQEKVGVDLPGDAKAKLKPKVDFLVHEIEPATTSFGQGFALTPLKLIQLNAILANGGNLVTPHVVAGLADSQGELHWQASNQSQRVFSPEITQKVLEMMETVVTEGSGKAAAIPGYRIAGKTGTAQKAILGGYDATAKITSFVAILPVESPRYAVLAVVDEPQGPHTYGSTVAAPIVGKVIESLIAIEGIPSSDP